jgi:OmcA/MtrC family decaheme c-type cytochrome
MRIPYSVFAVGRVALAVVAVAGSVVYLSAARRGPFTVHDRAYYADAPTANFVRAGLSISIVSAKVASDGTISVDYKIADPKGLPLDLAGLQTPGAVSLTFLAAYIPKGQAQFVDYNVRPQVSTITNTTANQAGTDSGGTTQTVAVGEYIYTFKQKAVPPSGSYDATATHRIGVYGSRNLTEFDLGTAYDTETYDFVPSGDKVTVTRDVVRTASCNKCHDQLSAHGGSRRGMDLCIMCHTPQTVDPDTGNSVDMKVFIHKIHMGSELPSVVSGIPYQIIGHGGSVSDYSTVVLPSDPRRCSFCHDSSTGATQANNYMTKPGQEACRSCHDNVNFATGANHANTPQADDSQCATCHVPQGSKEFDVSILGAHTIPTESATAPGINLAITKVENSGAGEKPTVTFTIKDNAGNGISMAQMTGGLNGLRLVMAGPTSDYGNTSFGSDVKTPGYVSETVTGTAQCSNDGTCTYAFTHAIPANATGTFAIGIEGRRGLSIPGQADTEYGATNKVVYFSVDGTPVVPRRTVVATKNCNSCHARLSLHGENRNQIEMCVLCHNPSENDASRRPGATTPSDKTLPPQSVNFALMVHKIHTGEKLAEAGQSYIIVGFGGSHNDFSDVRYPTMGPTGSVGDTAKCYMCHVNGSEAVFPIGKNNVADTQGPLNPAPATTSACTACHLANSALSHAVSQTDGKFGESCDICHAAGTDYNVTKVHAQ